ncbi:hypothetical protein EVAR_19198_1 [Eumeta japonica]|uniref:Uncharacterized protein n=1 Tax=Eumeta variegata TaxID=151549 RepID=A0A4C1VEN4_EUMVA|nr:hypothetical protein EVAR_19198_1 [Eumeta japonica]
MVRHSKVLTFVRENYPNILWLNASYQNGADGISGEQNDDENQQQEQSRIILQSITRSTRNRACTDTLHLYVKTMGRVGRTLHGRSQFKLLVVEYDAV